MPSLCLCSTRCMRASGGQSNSPLPDQASGRAAKGQGVVVEGRPVAVPSALSSDEEYAMRLHQEELRAQQERQRAAQQQQRAAPPRQPAARPQRPPPPPPKKEKKKDDGCVVS